MADADRRLDAALLQRVAARLLEAGLGQIAKAEQRPRGVAGADEHAVARKRRDRRIDAFDQALQPFDQRHRAAAASAAAIRMPWLPSAKFKPRAAAGHQPAERRAEAAQPLQPDRAARRQPARELRDLAAVRVGRAEILVWRDSVPLAAPNSRAPTGLAHSTLVPSTDHSHAGQGARRMHRQPRIAEASQLEFRVFIA